MKEREGKVKAVPIDDTKSETMQGIIHENVHSGWTICTDESASYRGVVYQQRSVNHSAREYVNGMAYTSGIESVWVVLKHGFNGTYHNSSKKHCHRQVNEFTFRLNEGNCERDTQDRLDDLFRSMTGKTITYKELTA